MDLRDGAHISIATATFGVQVRHAAGQMARLDGAGRNPAHAAVVVLCTDGFDRAL